MTLVEYKVGAGTWAAGGIVCALGGILCCFIPCCLKDCKDAYHRCGEC